MAKKSLLVLVLAGFLAGGVWAQSIDGGVGAILPSFTDAELEGDMGLTLAIDGFNFGNLAGDDWDFKTDADVTPVARYDYEMGDLTITGQASAKIGFNFDELAVLIGIAAQGAYKIAPAMEAGLYAKVGIPVGDGYKGNDKIAMQFAPWFKYTQDLGFGSLYAKLDVGIFMMDGEIAVGTGSEDHLTIGVNTDMGVYGFLRPSFDFYYSDGFSGGEVNDYVQDLDIGVGYKLADFGLDIFALVTLPLRENGFDNAGLTIDPRVTYTIAPNMKAYVDVKLGNIGAKEEKVQGIVIKDSKITVTPSIGFSFKL